MKNLQLLIRYYDVPSILNVAILRGLDLAGYIKLPCDTYVCLESGKGCNLLWYCDEVVSWVPATTKAQVKTLLDSRLRAALSPVNGIEVAYLPRTT